MTAASIRADQDSALPVADGPYRSMAAAVGDWVIEHPDRVAVVDADGSEVTYSMFGARAAALAADLVERARGRPTHVYEQRVEAAERLHGP